MEALVALGVASNVVQFVDFTAKLITRTTRIYRSTPKSRASGKDQSGDLELITQNFEYFNNELTESLREHQSSQVSTLAQADKDVLRLCTDSTKLTARLLGALGRLKSSKPTAWGSFVLALKTIWSESEIDDLRQTLDSYRQQLSLCLLVGVRHEIYQFQRGQAQLTTTASETRQAVESFFRDLKADSNWDQSVMRAMQQEYENQLQAGFVRQSPAEGMQKKLTKGDRTRFDHGLLNWLRFAELDTRYEKISEAYHKTYEWIFHDPPNNEWHNYSTWLTDESEPLYWVTGKPAAGKSTLMKFIYADPRTNQKLQSWAGKKLITCAYYFWNSGTYMQMSQEGMARTLLHSALQQEPGLWKILFPHHMEQFIAYTDPWQRPITWTEIMRALRLLVKGAGKRYRLFFFIDGLDEFDGDHSHLIELIQELVSPNVKSCVSSRPWNVFQDSFRKRPSLQLEDLTYGDIKLYVEQRFSANPGYHERRRETPVETDELVESITRKAAGVFLWVTLVTDSLLEGLSDGERLKDLRSRLDRLPADLETLFWKILTRLNVGQLKHTSQIFQILRATARPLGLLLLSYADEDDPNYIQRSIIHSPTKDQKLARADILRRRLNACCKGLIESKPLPGVETIDTEVGYLHRTVKDFVERPEIWPKFLEMTESSFNPCTRLCNAHTLMLLRDHTVSGYDEGSAKELTFHATCAVDYAIRADLIGNEDDEVLLLHLTDQLCQALCRYTNPLILSHSLLLATVGHRYLYFAKNVDDRISNPISFPNARLLKALMQSGANPNMQCSGITLALPKSVNGAMITTTPWEALVKVYTSLFSSSGAYDIPQRKNFRITTGEALKIYLDHGANPNVAMDQDAELRALAKGYVKGANQTRANEIKAAESKTTGIKSKRGSKRLSKVKELFSWKKT